MKEINLTRNLKTVVDDKYFDILNQYSWQATRYHPNINKFRATRTVRQGEKIITVAMHRVIMELEGHNILNKKIDHINCDGLDNRIENLRIATSSQNSQNKKKLSNNTSGYKGVYFQEGKWRVRIMVNNKNLSLGYFSSKEDAAKVYDNAAIKYYGEFANLNGVL